jgi:hypothetical protein
LNQGYHCSEQLYGVGGRGFLKHLFFHYQA